MDLQFMHRAVERALEVEREGNLPVGAVIRSGPAVDELPFALPLPRPRDEDQIIRNHLLERLAVLAQLRLIEPVGEGGQALAGLRFCSNGGVGCAQSEGQREEQIRGQATTRSCPAALPIDRGSAA